MLFLKKTIWFALAIPTAIWFFTQFSTENDPKRFHSEAELVFFKTHKINHSNGTSEISKINFGPGNDGLVIDSNILFPTARTCGGCHGRDSNKIAFLTADSVEINMYDDWRSSIMGNSAKDPFWRAKVMHESLVNPSHAIELQDKCTTCHAPTGHYQAKLHDKKAHYGLADVLADTLGLDGVTCQACHAQGFEGIGTRHSGDILFDTTRVSYGPYEMAFTPPMHNFVGITPKYGQQIEDAGLCASCHTLITSTVDLAGGYTGGTFVEQATYHEWLNSTYNDNQKTCQSCHLPQVNEPIVISANYGALPAKKPFGIHEMAGGNTLMLNVLKENRQALGIQAEPEMFDSTIAATMRMLQQKTLDLTLSPGVLSGDTAFFDLRILNKAGHKFPSGYPSRRAFVQFLMTTTAGDTLFFSGKMNPDFSLKHESPTLTEPHFQSISAENQTQIYEFVAADVNGNFTTILERGAFSLKDNRLPPAGFTSDDTRWDTTKIVGAALTDPNFNRIGATEGWGGDILHFKIPIGGFNGKVNVLARVLYQSIPPKWLNEIFLENSPLINNWKSMYYAADRSPVVIASATLAGLDISSVGTKNAGEKATQISLFPNPTDGREVFLQNPAGLKIRSLKIFSADGKLLFEEKSGRQNGSLPMPEKRGIYLVAIETERGKWVEKVILK